jgi:hypothetical protein
MATEFDIDEQAQRATTGTQAFTGTLLPTQKFVPGFR